MSNTQQPVNDTRRRRIRGVERRSIDYVPLAERHGRAWHLTSVWFTGDAHLATIAVGAIGASLGGNLIWSAIAVVTGSFFGTFFMAFHSTQGPQLGLPQMVQSRPQFGYVGALLVWIVALVTYVGYGGFNTVLMGDTLQHLFGTPVSVTFVVFVVVAAVLACVGYDLIHGVSRWLGLIMLLSLTVFSISVLTTHHFSSQELALTDFKLIPYLVQFFTAAFYQLSWAIYVSDYSRYLPPNVGVFTSFIWTYLGASIGGTWMMLVGTVAVALYPSASLVSAVASTGDAAWPGLGMVFLIVSAAPLVTITTLNFYGASLTLLSAISSFRRIATAPRARIMAIGAVATIALIIAFAADKSFLEEFGHFLEVLGLLFTPWTAINLVDFYVIRHAHYSIREIFNPRGMYGRWSWQGLSAYVIGFLSMLPFAVIGSFEGPVARMLGGIDISMLVGLAVSAVAYWISCRGIDIDAERIQIAISDRDLEVDTR